MPKPLNVQGWLTLWVMSLNEVDLALGFLRAYEQAHEMIKSWQTTGIVELSNLTSSSTLQGDFVKEQLTPVFIIAAWR
ncbi:uncharacterized protein L201_000062 [Kwoniella dendrophila CBS 6074]|uniref:Uncharacterized protein n=1 Tax=Kwoniella dendrophila CBS 6074 TaxID=1295534 RepID=A0AAX4JJW0_9TREE